MAKSFGTWLTRYKGQRIAVQALGQELKRACREYEMHACELVTPDEVFAFLTPSGDPDPNLTWHLQRAAEEWPGFGSAPSKAKKQPTLDLFGHHVHRMTDYPSFEPKGPRYSIGKRP